MTDQASSNSLPIGFLLGRASRVMVLRIERVLHEHGHPIGIEHWIVLQQLSEGHLRSQSALIELLGRDKTAVARLLARMEEEGWIRREADAKDRRNKCIAITEKGRGLRDSVEPILKEVNRDVEEKLSPERLKASKALLEELFQQLKCELEHSSPL